MMGEEIGQGFTISNFQAENLANLTLGETCEGSCLKENVALTLLTSIFQTFTMFNKINNLLGLNAILNGEPIGVKNHVRQQCGINIGESSNSGNNIS
jgi:hypothetical protein